MAVSMDPSMMELVNELHKKMGEQIYAITHANHPDLYSLGKLQGGLFALEEILETIKSLGSEGEEF